MFFKDGGYTCEGLDFDLERSIRLLHKINAWGIGYNFMPELNDTLNCFLVWFGQERQFSQRVTVETNLDLIQACRLWIVSKLGCQLSSVQLRSIVAASLTKLTIVAGYISNGLRIEAWLLNKLINTLLVIKLFPNSIWMITLWSLLGRSPPLRYPRRVLSSEWSCFLDWDWSSSWARDA